MPHLMLSTSNHRAGNIPNYDSGNPLGFLTSGGTIQSYADKTGPVNDISPGQALVVIPQNAGKATSIEVSFRNVSNSASTSATLVVSIWEYTVSFVGSVGTYTVPTSPITTISLSVPSGNTNLIYGTTAISHTFGSGSAAAVSVQISDVSVSSGYVFASQYLASVSGYTQIVLNSYIDGGLTTANCVYGIGTGGSAQVVKLITTGPYTSPSGLPGSIAMTLVGSTMGLVSQVIPVTGHIVSQIASFFTTGIGNDSTTPPVVGIYHQAQNTGGQSSLPFTNTNVGNQVNTGTSEATGATTATVTSTLTPTNGSWPVTAGDRFIVVVATNSWTHIGSVSVQTFISVP